MAFASTAAGLYAARDTSMLQRLVSWTRIIVLGSLAVAVVMIVFGNVFLQFYGGPFTESRTALAIMAPRRVPGCQLRADSSSFDDDLLRTARSAGHSHRCRGQHAAHSHARAHPA